MANPVLKSAWREHMEFTRTALHLSLLQKQIEKDLDIDGYWKKVAVDTLAPPKHHDLWITKRHLVVREAWTIGPHDIDCMPICPDDDPVILADVDKLPVVELLAERRRI